MEILTAIDAFNERREHVALSLKGRGESQTVLGLSGELDLQGSSHLTPTLALILQGMSPGARLVLDMSAVRYISSTGVGMLTNILLTAKKNGKSVELTNMQPKVAGVLQLLGVMQFFESDGTNAKD